MTVPTKMRAEPTKLQLFYLAPRNKYYTVLPQNSGQFAQRATIVFACIYSIAQLYCNHYAQAGTFNVII